jgi:CRP-like cAMP-binding protein
MAVANQDRTTSRRTTSGDVQPGRFWDALSEQNRRELASAGHRRRFRRGDVVFHQDEDSDYVLVLQSGCVKVVAVAENGYQSVLALLEAGDLIGELASIDGGRRSATVSALTAVTALVVPADRFGRLRGSRPELERIVQRTLSGRLRSTDRHLTGVGAASVPTRLATLLLALADSHGTPGARGGVAVDLPLSQEDLAGILLTSKRTVGRVLEQWRAKGWVETGRFSIVVVNVPALRALAGQVQ